MQRAKDDIDAFGYCILGPNVLPPDRVDWVMGRLMEQAEAEAREGVDAQGIHKNLEEANQSVKSLQNKGLTELLQHKDVLEVVGHVLGGAGIRRFFKGGGRTAGGRLGPGR